MLEVMWGYLKRESGSKYVLDSIKYRNLAPLYCDEEMRICIKKKKSLKDGVYDIWIEGPTGGVAVNGVVRTAERVHVNSVQRAPIGSTLGVVNIRKILTERPTIKIPPGVYIGKRSFERMIGKGKGGTTETGTTETGTTETGTTETGTTETGTTETGTAETGTAETGTTGADNTETATTKTATTETSTT
jgi:hypothetical protein